MKWVIASGLIIIATILGLYSIYSPTLAWGTFNEFDIQVMYNSIVLWNDDGKIFRLVHQDALNVISTITAVFAIIGLFMRRFRLGCVVFITLSLLTISYFFYRSLTSFYYNSGFVKIENPEYTLLAYFPFIALAISIILSVLTFKERKSIK